MGPRRPLVKWRAGGRATFGSLAGMLRRVLLLLTFVLACPALALATGTITGRVVVSGTDVPVTGARVLVAEGTTETTTDATGAFTLAQVPDGAVTVVVLRDGYAPLSQPVTVQTGQTVTLDIQLPFAPRVSQELTVLGRLSDYVEATASAAKTSERLLNVPQAIQVLPAQFLADIGALDTKDIYKHVSGVADSSYSSTVVRGFTQREVLINGVRGNPYGSLDGDINNAGFSTSQFRLSNVERVEVLKGPSSVLYGSSEPGGVINYVTRRPRERFDLRFTAGTGMFDQRLAEIDVTGPVNAKGTLLARGAFFFEQRDVNRYNAGTDNRHGVGGLLWRPHANTSLTFDYEYIWQRNEGHRLRGVPVDASGRFQADIRWTATEPSDVTDLEANVAQGHWDQVLGRGIRLETTVRVLSYDRRESYHEPRGLTAGGTLMQRDYRVQLRTNDDWTLASGAIVPFTTGPIRHELATGVEFVSQDHSFRSATLPQASAGGPVLPLSLQSPVYGLTPAYTVPESRFGTDLADSLRSGLYVQDLMAIGNRWRVLLGTRLDRYDDNGLDRNGVVLDTDQNAVTGRIGLVFKPAEPISLYGNVANGFTRASVLSQSPSANGPHDPETSRQVEGGAKTDLFGGKAQVTLAAFDTIKRNVLRPDPNFGPDGTNPNAVLATGRVRNRGLELDLAGQLTSRWNLAVNYTYLRSRIEQDPTPSVVGQPMPNAAPHMFGLFTRFDLPFGTSLAGAVEYRDRRREPFANLVAPAYTVVDLHVFQQITRSIRLQVRADNIFNEQYAAFSLFAARVGNVPGAPRTISVLFMLNHRAGRATP